MTDLQYPIGKFQPEGPLSDERRRDCIAAITETPAAIRTAVAGLSEAQLDTPYRPGGWTVRQVVHHVADSHLNSYIRFKLALTEEEPTIKPYQEQLWAELEDGRSAPIEISLALLETLHRRLVLVLRSLTETEFRRKFRHPEIGLLDLDTNLSLYAWHGRHHAAHITSLRQRMGW